MDADEREVDTILKQHIPNSTTTTTLSTPARPTQKRKAKDASPDQNTSISKAGQPESGNPKGVTPKQVFFQGVW